MTTTLAPPLVIGDEQLELALFLAHAYLEYGQAAKANVMLHALQAAGVGGARVRVLRALALVRLNHAGQALAVLDETALRGELPLGYHLVRAQALALSGRNREAADAYQAFLHAPGSTAAADAGARPLHQRRVTQE
ncbi:hypothetical protein [Pandoraea iniqua]|nr:hypothetical protein [Pandoraea iniqua]